MFLLFLGVLIVTLINKELLEIFPCAEGLYFFVLAAYPRNRRKLLPAHKMS